MNALTLSIADHVQITALCRVLRLDIKVAYLDGRGDTGTVEFVDFQNESAAQEPITLLYRCVHNPSRPPRRVIIALYARPGHYDILIKNPSL